MQQLTTGKPFEPFRGFVQCLEICRIKDSLRAPSLLGESAGVDGAFEWLESLIRTSGDSQTEIDLVDRSWDRAKIKMVKIV